MQIKGKIINPIAKFTYYAVCNFITGCLCMKLIEVSTGQSACIDNIDKDYVFFRRLIELGFYRGVEITPLFSSLVKGSRAYDICGAVLALRNTVAENIDVTLNSGGRYEK